MSDFVFHRFVSIFSRFCVVLAGGGGKVVLEFPEAFWREKLGTRRLLAHVSETQGKEIQEALFFLVLACFGIRSVRFVVSDCRSKCRRSLCMHIFDCGIVEHVQMLSPKELYSVGKLLVNSVRRTPHSAP